MTTQKEDIQLYYDNKVKKVEYTIVNGIKEGLEKGYLPNGKLLREVKYNNGEKYGLNIGMDIQFHIKKKITKMIVLMENLKDGIIMVN